MMKAITLWQPWASLVAMEEKKFETRSWATSYRGPLLIHTAKGAPIHCQTLANIDKQFNNALTGSTEWNPNIWETLPFGSVIAICNLVDCVEITAKFLDTLSAQEVLFGNYERGRYAWQLEDVHRLKTPIPAKGHQRLWMFDEKPHLISIDPWKIGDTKIWIPQGIRTGQQVPPGTEDAVLGLEVV